MRILVTCPPMIRRIEDFKHVFETQGFEIYCPEVVQTLSVPELIELVPQFDGWIVGDDPVTVEVLSAGKNGRLKAVVKWGVGIDNIDFAGAKKVGLPITNTPQMFGKEVADLAMSYVTGLARETYVIDRGVRAGGWPKPAGISLADKTVALVGFGDIGNNAAKRMLAADMKVIAYDPWLKADTAIEPVEVSTWPERVNEADFIVLTCALTPNNRHMLNADVLARAKPGVRVVNVARGPLIDEAALISALSSGHVHSAALDVFEEEPLPLTSALRGYEHCIFGSHNASNTVDAVRKTSYRAIQLLTDFLKEVNQS